MKAFLFPLLLLLAACAVAQQRAPMPEIPFQTPQKGSAKVSDYRGKVVYVDFWASWCGPCLAAQPSLVSLSQRMEGKDVVILSLSVDAKPKKWKKALKKHQPAGVQGYIGRILPESLDIQFIPRYMILDRAGNIVEIEAKGPAQADDSLLKVLAE